MWHVFIFSPRALGHIHVLELFHMKAQSNLPYSPKEQQSWISCASLYWSSIHRSFVFWQNVHRMLAQSLEADSSAVRQDTRGCIEPEQTMKLCTGRKLTQHTLTPFIAEKTYLENPSQSKCSFYFILFYFYYFIIFFHIACT